MGVEVARVLQDPVVSFYLPTVVGPSKTDMIINRCDLGAIFADTSAAFAATLAFLGRPLTKFSHGGLLPSQKVGVLVSVDPLIQPFFKSLVKGLVPIAGATYSISVHGNLETQVPKSQGRRKPGESRTAMNNSPSWGCPLNLCA